MGSSLAARWRCRQTRRVGMVLVVAALVVAVGLAGMWIREPVPVPGEDWEWMAPDSAGFNQDRLLGFSDWLGGSGCIVYEGHMIHAWGDYTTPWDIASTAKPIYKHLVLVALQEGLIGSLDDRLTDFLPELMDLNAHLEFKDREMTWRHLLTQTSGYGLAERPGDAFAYNDVQTGLLVHALVRRVYACGYTGADAGLLEDRLGRWLGFQDEPTMRHPRSLPGRIRMSPRDLARFGHLYMNRGKWGRERLVERHHVDLTLKSPMSRDFPVTGGKLAERLSQAGSIGGSQNMGHHMGYLSHFWWLNRRTIDDQLLFPDAPACTFSALGHEGRTALVVMPGLRLVVVWADAFKGRPLSPFERAGRWSVNAAIRALLEARSVRYARSHVSLQARTAPL